MEVEPTDDLYFTFEGRLASFQKTKKRGSTAKGGRALNWPHKKIDPEQLARAGFFFQPWPENPDNVACYLCHKSMDGWEEGDDPLIEHLKHSTSCGWAICAAVESEVEGFAQVHPAEKDMVEARKATFAGRWPHDAKRGWKCKTKQLVDAGWKYTPTPEANDNTTCTYCGLGLDGWEQNDKPYDEHYNRSPHCPFFALSALPKPKASRAKTARGSKVSRLSTQSIATFTSEAPSLAETTFATAVGNDTVLSTTSTMATKKGRAPKATTIKGKKSKAKKGEPTPEPEEQAQFEEVQLEADREVTPEAPPPKKATRGKKRGSEAVNESILTVTSEAPARKKRATTTRGNVAVDSSVAEATDDSQMTDVPAPALKKKSTAKKERASAAKSRKAPQSKTPTVEEPPAQEVPQEVPAMFPDDEEIERQLEADLERPLTDDDDITADSDSERRKAKAKANKTKAPGQEKSTDYAMFDPSPPEELQEAEVDAELEALRHEMEVEPVESNIPPQSEPDLDREPAVPEEPEQLTVPKKGRKAGTRKASKQTKTKKAKVVAAPVAEEPEPEPEHVLEPELEPQEVEVPGARNESIGSTDTVVKNTEVEIEDESDGRSSFHSATSRKSTTAEEFAEGPVVKKKPRGRPSKASLASQKSVEFVNVPIEAPEPIAEPTANIKKKLTKKVAPAPEPVLEPAPEAASDEVESLEPPSAAPQPAKRPRGRPSKASLGAQAPVESIEPADDSVVVVEAVQKPAKKGRGRPSKASTEALEEPVEADAHKVEHAEPVEAPAPAKRGRGRPSKAVQEASAAAAASSQPQPQAAEQAPKRGRGRPPKKSSIESKPEEAEAQLQQEAMDAETRQIHQSQDDELEILEDEPDLPPTQEAVNIPSSPPARQAVHPPSTPGLSATSARQAGLSPSQSPQSSDAENQPPSSRPTGSVTTQRVALAPMAATPTRLSPSKRNILSNLQSKTPWKAVDLDAVLESPLKGSVHPDENTVDRLLRKGGELTAKEKGMTVEEWVHYNASLAEDMLKGQCEKMVNRFESEGGRAMNVLENIEVE